MLTTDDELGRPRSRRLFVSFRRVVHRSIEELVQSTPDPGGVEQAQIIAALQRYGTVVRGGSVTLALSWSAILLWAPLLLMSARGRRTFAAATVAGEPMLGGTATHGSHFAAMDDESRERAYRDAAQQVDRSTPASRWF